MEGPLSVLLRDNTHNSATVRLALKADQLSFSYSRTPLHIAIPFSEPQIFDIGTNRPTINMSGVIDTEGGDVSNTTGHTSGTSDYAFKGMASDDLVGPDGSGGTNTKTYYIPYKNYLEGKLLTWTTTATTDLQIEIGDATTPVATSGAFATGGGIYPVAVQQFQFTLAPGMEDRYTYSIQFIAKFRDGISF